MNKTYISLGSNRGNRTANLNRAINLLSEWVGNVTKVSSLYETPPWKMADKTDFYNQVLLLETILPETELIDTVILVETMMGRLRTSNKYEPRIIDIDILFFNEEIINTEELPVPHPLITERKFVLVPMVEIAPEFIHPVFKKTMVQLLDECEDKSEIRKLVSK
jgi:2-amino-4-hydroxy-6-hydroxymethyldihydropteridine diphosphokinase